VGRLWTEIEVPVLIHGRNLEHGNVHGFHVFAVQLGQLGIAHGTVKSAAHFDDLSIHAGAVPRVPGEVPARVGHGENLGHPHGYPAPDLDIGQFRGTSRQCLVRRHRVAQADAVVHPVPRFDDLYSFFSRN